MPSLADIAKMDTKDIDFGSLLSGLKLPARSGSRPRKGGGTLVGLDIQPGWATAVEASVNGVVSVERAAGVPLPPDVVRDGEVLDEGLLTEALRELFRDGKMNRRVRVGLANQRSVVRLMELPPITDRKELEAAVAFQATDQIPMPLNTAVLDFHPLGIVETPGGKRQRVAVVAAQQEMVERLVRAVSAAGLRPIAVDLSAFAMIRALHRRSAAGAETAGAEAGDAQGEAAGDVGAEASSAAGGEASSGVAASGAETSLAAAASATDGASQEQAIPSDGVSGEARQRTLYLNVGGLTNLAIAEGVTCRFTRTVGGGLESMAAQLAERQTIPLTEARAAIAAIDLRAAGDEGSAGGATSSEAVQILRGGLRDIAGEIRNSIDFHRAQEGGNVVDSVVLSGSALEIPGFSEALEAELGHSLSRRTVALAGGSELKDVPVERLTIAAGLAVEEVAE